MLLQSIWSRGVVKLILLFFFNQIPRHGGVGCITGCWRPFAETGTNSLSTEVLRNHLFLTKFCPQFGQWVSGEPEMKEERSLRRVKARFV